MKNTKLTINGKDFELPMVEGSEGEEGIDISALRSKTGYITLDTGYKSTGSTKSAITFLDGENGILRYRGYPIEQLAEHSAFLEVAYLLIYGDLPAKDQFDDFVYKITRHTLIHEDMKKLSGQGTPNGCTGVHA